MTSAPARRLAAALEPVIGGVFFAPECHEAYTALGFNPSPGVSGGVAQPDGVAYVTSRAASMGQVVGEVAVAAFGVFSPAYIVPAIAAGWTKTDAHTIAVARATGAAAQLERILGPATTGVGEITEQLEFAAQGLALACRPLAAGVRALGPVGDGWARLFWIGDLLREYRGDSHNAAWAAAGLDGTEVSLLSDPYRGLPLRSYSRTRGWSHTDLDIAHAGLVARGWFDDDGITEAGRIAREAIEQATDLQMQTVIDGLGPDLDSVVTQLRSWSDAVRAAGGYPDASPLNEPA